MKFSIKLRLIYREVAIIPAVFNVILQALLAGITAKLPCKLGEVWFRISKIINEISAKFEWVFLKVIHLDVNLDVNSQPFFM